MNANGRGFTLREVPPPVMGYETYTDAFDHIDKKDLDGAAKALAEGGWDKVYELYPELSGPILANKNYLSSARKLIGAGGFPKDEAMPRTGPERLGAKLVTAIGRLARKYGYVSPNYKPRRKKIEKPTTKDEFYKVLLKRYEQAAKQFGWIPDDEILGFFLNAKQLTFAKVRDELSPRWSFVPEAGGFTCTEKPHAPDDVRDMFNRLVEKYPDLLDHR